MKHLNNIYKLELVKYLITFLNTVVHFLTINTIYKIYNSKCGQPASFQCLGKGSGEGRKNIS